MKNKDGVEVKNGQLWMSLDKSRPMRICKVKVTWEGNNYVELENISNRKLKYVQVKNMHPNSKGWKLIGTAL